MSRLFGTNGVRGVVNRDLTAEMVVRLGGAIGAHLRGGRVGIATDTRTSRHMLKGAAVAGLLGAGCTVVDAGECPTPCLQYFVKTRGLAGGVIVTASHNPPEYNGIKVVDAEGMEIGREREEAIEALYQGAAGPGPPWQDLKPLVPDPSAREAYLRAIQGRVDAGAIQAARFRVVLDCGNGASCYTSPYLLRDLGCQVTTLNGQPDGMFPGHPSEPVRENVEELLEATRAAGADVGMVHDGDADRVIFVDEAGHYVDGDQSLALVAQMVVKGKGGGTVVTPVSSSSCVEDVVRTAGGRVQYTKVGAPVVARTMFEMGAVFGGEENGGLILPDHQYCRDGAMGAAKMLEILARAREPLSKLVARIPKYALDKSTLHVPAAKKEATLRGMRASVDDLKVETIDGMKIHYPEGWVLVRPSGTEEVFRIFAEGRDPPTAKALARRGRELLQRVMAELG